MLHRQLRNALEEIFGVPFITEALDNPQIAENILYQRPDEFKVTVLGFQRLNYQDEHTAYAADLEHDLGIALICALLDNDTRALVSDLGLNYL